MLTIGEFSNICKVSTKTLRYYANIDLILPVHINPETGYRYYAVEQLETMLFIERLKMYNFSLEEIKVLISSKENKTLLCKLHAKEKDMKKQLQSLNKTIEQLHHDIKVLEEGKSILSYLDDIDVQLIEVAKMNLLSIRKKVLKEEFENEYQYCFGELMKKIHKDNLTILAPPMVLFHENEFDSLGLETEFAIPIKEYITGTKDFCPGLCLKTTLHGPYTNLPSIYTRQCEWAKREGYKNKAALFEVYVIDPSQILHEDELITEIYFPVYRSKEGSS